MDMGVVLDITQAMNKLAAAKNMRQTDAICIGVYTRSNQAMVADDVKLFEDAWRQGKGTGA
jgi:hypothetical protein